MSTAVFPTDLTGIGLSITRTPTWATRKQQAVSGKITTIADWSYPIWQWDISYDVLRQGSVNGATWTEWAEIAGFYNARSGGFDSFLYADVDDYAIVNQALGSTDGHSQYYQLSRTMAGGGFTFIEPILAPDTSNSGASFTSFTIGGVAQTLTYVPGVGWGGSYGGNLFGIYQWGGANAPGQIAFATPPTSGLAMTASFSYWWPCRFIDDQCAFERFTGGRYLVKKLSFQSIK